MVLSQNRVVLGTWCTGSEQGCINGYLVLLSQFWIVLVVVRAWRYWFSRGRHRVLCLYIMEKMEIWSDVTDLDLSDGQFSERCDVDGSFFNSDAIPIIFGKA